MKLYDHQVQIANEAYSVLKEHGLVYIAAEERTGKTLAAIHVAELSSCNNVLVITKKKALGGWNETLGAYCNERSSGGKYAKNTTIFTVVNYHGVHKARKLPSGKRVYELNLDPGAYDLIILDEAHNYLSTYPKPGVIWKSVKKLCEKKPLIYLSATPNAQGYQLLFNQFALSSWSPWKRFKNFYAFFTEYGIPSKVRTAYGLQETYSKCKSVVWDEVKHLFITYTRQELGFEHEPEDVLHYIELSEETKKLYNSCLKDELFEFKDWTFPLDSSMKLRTTLHMLEGGVAKNEDEYIVLPNREKIDAILRDFGDSANNVIMYHYKAELVKLREAFKHTILLQGTSFSEGVDLSHYDNLIIYSQDFSSARHSQRRARQANKERDTEIKVHFYLVKGGISEQVYKTVSVNKKNFIDTMFVKEEL